MILGAIAASLLLALVAPTLAVAANTATFDEKAEAQKLLDRNYNQKNADIFRQNLDGRRLAAAGEFEAAEASLKTVLKQYPNNEQSLYALAEMYYLKASYQEAIDLLARALRAGHSLTAAIEMVARETADPVGGEFRRVFEEQNFGLPIREALLNLARRLPVADLQFLVTAMLVQKETGGNLAEVLDKTCAVIRDRARLLGQLYAGQAVRHCQRPVAARREEVPEEVQHERVIIDAEHGEPHGRGLRARQCR